MASITKHAPRDPVWAWTAFKGGGGPTGNPCRLRPGEDFLWGKKSDVNQEEESRPARWKLSGTGSQQAKGRGIGQGSCPAWTCRTGHLNSDPSTQEPPS